MSFNRKMSYELRLAYICIFLFIAAQYVVNEHPWDQAFRIAGLLAFIGSMLLSGRRRVAKS
jgi:hypothetical protein